MSSRILLVEDESGIVDILGDLLRAEGHTVESAGNGTTGLKMVDGGHFDLLILDVLLPGMSGLEVCHGARERGFDGGILMLTAMGGVTDRIEGLRTGADDYLAKPFDPDELLARVEALLRRVKKVRLTPVTRFEFGSVVADFSEPSFVKNGMKLSLSAKECDLLKMLVNHRDRVVTRDEILGEIWIDQPFITPRTVDVHIAWLRQKLEDKPDTPKHILTVRGEGYRFVK